jgi:hypothetical protein
MINIGSELKNELQNYEITPVTLIDLHFPDTEAVPAGGPMRITDAPRDVVFEGVTYVSSDEIRSIAAPQTQNSVDRDNYSIVFTDADIEMRNRFAVTYTGVPLRVRVVFRKKDGSLTGEALNVYKGQSSTVLWTDTDGDATCAIGFTGQLTQLEAKKVVMTTPASQETVDPTDTCMQFSHNAVEDVALRWGKR